jgi:signal transduction histidine kinase
MRSDWIWWGLIGGLVIVIAVLHYATPTMRWQYHLIYMQSFFLPILIGAFQFGVRGGLGTAIAVSFIYFPHIMLQWGGFQETNLMRFLQILLFNAIGYITGVLSEQRMAENRKYRQAAAELERSLQRLKEQSDQLAELEEKLRVADRLAVVGELTASLAHEVRNPLGAIRGATEILQEELPHEAKASEFFKILIEETDRLSNVVENYLSLARKHASVRAQMEIAAIAGDVLRLFAYSTRKAGIRARVVAPDYPVFVWGDPIHLRQILANLVLNAIQAMKEGGELTIRIFTEGNDAILEVSDSGPGIPPEKLEEIFRPFFTTKTNGTGLGLSIVKRLVDQNGWSISVESEQGRGSTFRIRMSMLDHKSAEK